MAGDKANSSNTITTPHSSLPAPLTPHRLSFSSRPLPSPTRASPSSTAVLDPALGYSVARRPRLDFARACTSLHHSTIAEQSSPESSPLASNAFPTYLSRRQLDSPTVLHSNPASAVGSYSFIDSSAPSGDDSSTTSEDEELDLDPMSTETPTTSTFRQADASSASSSQPVLPAASMSLMRRQKAKRRGPVRSTRQSSSSASGSSGSLASPSPTTPPAHVGGSINSYFTRVSDANRRRDSLSKALNDAFMLDHGNTKKNDEDQKEASDPIRRVVSRRGNLLPKTKNFQRVKAALLEETSLPDMEIRKEAEITRQLREDGVDAAALTKIPAPPLLDSQQPTDSTPDDDAMSDTTTPPVGPLEKPRELVLPFNQQAQLNSSFLFDPLESVNGSPPRYPPPTRNNSDGDIIMNFDSSVASPSSVELRRSKRRRTQDERFESPNTFKRRAVSPGVCNSPILGGSPSSTPVGGGKRLNLQGMNDTNEGLMKMTL